MVLATADSTESLKLQIDSYPFSAESSFRELDDVFLQTQTRIWLGEVLKTRFDEEMSIADLLADGIVLFDVSGALWKMLLTKFMKLRSSVAYFSRSASGKNRGRYMPYSNVDAFLKICQILGLTGIDLFSPSDVVEKRDIRRVCMCIRSLSKKAISKDLSVPDFDNVTYTVAMPTDMVKGIRNSLEQSKSGCSEDSAGYNTYLVSRMKYGQKNFGGDTAREYDSYSEGSDHSDGNFQLLGCDSTEFTTCSGVSLLNSDLENSQQGSSLVLENFDMNHSMFQTDVEDEEIDMHNNDLYSPSPEAKSSLNAKLLLSNHQFNDTLLDGRLSRSDDYSVEQNAGNSCANSGPVGGALNSPKDEMFRVSPVNLEMESCGSFMGSSMDHYKSETDIIDHSSTSFLNGCGAESDESATFNAHGKDDLHRGADPLYDTSLYQHGNKSFEDGNVFTTAFSDFGKAKTINYGDKFEESDAFSNPNIDLPQHQDMVENNIAVDRTTLNTDQLPCHSTSNERNGSEATESLTLHDLSGSSICQSPSRVSRDDDDISYCYSVSEGLKVSGSNTEGSNEDLSNNLRYSSLLGDCPNANIDSTSEDTETAAPRLAAEDENYNDRDTRAFSKEDDCLEHRGGGIVLDPCIHASEKYPSMCTCSGNDGREGYLSEENEFKLGHQTCTNHGDDASFRECLDKEKIKNEQVVKDIGASDRKLRRKRLVKSFAGGMSAFAVFLLLLRLRRPNGREKISETTVPPLKIIKSNKGEVSGKNRHQNGSTHGVYPAGKLRF